MNSGWVNTYIRFSQRTDLSQCHPPLSSCPQIRDGRLPDSEREPSSSLVLSHFVNKPAFNLANNSLQYHIPSTIYRLFLPLLLLRNITELNSIRLIFLLFSTLLATIRAGIVSPFLPKEDGYKGRGREPRVLISTALLKGWGERLDSVD